MITKISREWDRFQKQMREQRWLDDEFNLRAHYKLNEVISDAYRDNRTITYKADIDIMTPKVNGKKITMVRSKLGEEINEFEQDEIRNIDIPDNRVFIEMGLNHEVNPWVDNPGGECRYNRKMVKNKKGEKVKVQNRYGKVRHMDSVDFRERCVIVGNKLYALYLKGRNDFQPPKHLRQEILFETIPAADRKISDRLVKFFRKTDARKDVVKGLVNGYYNMFEGFKIWTKPELEDQMKEFEDMESTLERIPEEGENNERTLHDERVFYWETSNKMIEQGYCTQFSSVMQQINYIERHARESMRLGWLKDGEPDLDMLATQTEVEFDDQMNEEEELVDPKEEAIINTGEYGAFPLYFEDDGLDIEYINDIKAANVNELKSMQRDMFPTYNDYTGKESRAVLYYLTDLQKSVFWSFISWRKQQLIDKIKKTASEEIMRVIGFVLKNGKTKAIRALILSMGRGEAFSISDELFEVKPSDDEYWMMWEAYKEAGKKKKSFKF